MEPITQDGALVTISLVLVAVFAVLTIIAMLWGARLKRQRRAAEQEEVARIDALKADGVEATNTAEGVPERAATPASVTRPPNDSTTAPETPRAAAIADPVPSPASDERPIDALSPADVAPVIAPGAQSITILKGLGPKIEARLAELGITRLDQLAWLDDAEAETLDAQLGVFQGRMERDRWREQARLLAQDDRAGYEAQFGRLG